ncbi:MAG: NAD(P)H-dependent oxidoreductase [Candidatus Obscuribacterales bacterium]|nr:NAD(P)H-dependent oxidoreductase [Candidatus Obscuribacterales bacterium]
MSYLVISTSLNPESRSLLLAKEAHRLLSLKGKAELLDLRKARLPHFDGGKSAQSRAVKRVKEKIQKATTIIIAAPVYNYDVGAAAKNLIELTGDAFTDKTVGFMCAAGGKGSRMAFLGLAGSMLMDFRCLIIPDFVVADKGAFEGERIVEAFTNERLQLLVDKAVKLDGAGLPK